MIMVNKTLFFVFGKNNELMIHFISLLLVLDNKVFAPEFEKNAIYRRRHTFPDGYIDQLFQEEGGKKK